MSHNDYDLKNRFALEHDISFLSAQVDDDGSPLCEVYYSHKGVTGAYGLILDLDKGCFLETSVPTGLQAEVQLEYLQNMAREISNYLCKKMAAQQEAVEKLPALLKKRNELENQIADLNSQIKDILDLF